MSDWLPPDLGKKMRALLDKIDAGQAAPDPLDLLMVAGLLKDHGEWSLARDYERRARRLLPKLRRDLS